MAVTVVCRTSESFANPRRTLVTSPSFFSVISANTIPIVFSPIKVNIRKKAGKGNGKAGGWRGKSKRKTFGCNCVCKIIQYGKLYGKKYGKLYGKYAI
jgi:hypothetical protein